MRLAITIANMPATKPPPRITAIVATTISVRIIPAFAGNAQSEDVTQ